MTCDSSTGINMGDNHQHQNKHGDGGCNCQSSNREVHQTIDEMEFERGIWAAGEKLFSKNKRTTAIEIEYL